LRSNGERQPDRSPRHHNRPHHSSMRSVRLGFLLYCIVSPQRHASSLACCTTIQSPSYMSARPDFRTLCTPIPILAPPHGSSSCNPSFPRARSVCISTHPSSRPIPLRRHTPTSLRIAPLHELEPKATGSAHAYAPEPLCIHATASLVAFPTRIPTTPLFVSSRVCGPS